MSYRLTFSLASLILIFALAFAAMPVIAATGGPTVTISDAGTTATPSTRAAFLLKFVFSKSVEGFETGDATFRYYDKSNTLIGTAANVTITAVTNKPAEYTASLDVSSPETGAVGFVVTVAADVATSLDATSPIGNQAKSMRFTLPPLHIGKVVINAKKDADDTDATDGQDYDLTFTFKAQTGAPTEALTAERIVVEPSYVNAPVTVGTDAQGTDPATDYIYNATITHPAGAPDLTIGLEPSYVVAANVTTATIPPPVTATQNPPMAMIEVSGHDPAERSYRISVTFTPAADSLGNAGAAIKGFDSTKLDIKDASTPPAEVLTTVEAERKADNSYTAILKYDLLSTLPLTVKVKQSAQKTSNPNHSVMVGDSGGTRPPANAPAKPAAPTAMRNAANDLIIDVSWTAPADNGSAITGYTVKKYMGTTNTVVKTFPDDDPNTATITGTSYMVGPVPAADRGMSFTFTVTAMNANGASAESDRSAAYTVPAAPTTNTAPTFGTGTVPDIVLWTGQSYKSGALPLATDDVGDTITYSITPDLPDGLRHSQQDAQNYFIEGTVAAAMAKTAYKYIASDQHGAMNSLNFNITVKAPVVPTAPTLVSAMENRPENNNKIVSTWTGPTGDFGSAITNYVVYVTPVGGSMMSYETPNATTMTHTTPMSMPRGMYDVQVAAKNSVGIGAKSNKITVTVADPPGIPTDLSAALLANSSTVTLSWRAPVNPDGRTIDDGGSPITGYKLKMIQAGREVGSRLLPANPTSTFLRNLAPGQYVFRVIAVNADGDGQPSTDTHPPTVVPAVIQPPSTVPPTARIDTSIPLPIMTIPANGFVVLQRNPADSGIYPQVRTVTVGLANLDHLFRDRGGMALHGAGSANDLVFSEIMWGSDSSLADDSHSQWIELYNTTGGTLQLSNYRLEFYSARVAPTAGAIDEINSLNWGSLHGQRGRTSGQDTQGRFSEPVEIISMYLKINYPRVERSQARGEQLKDFPNGSSHGHWAASTRPSLNIDSTWRLATPGMKPRFTIHGASSLRQNVIITEFGNSSEDGYDWVELYNTTDGVINLKKWELSYVHSASGVGKETSLFRFPDNDSHRLPGKSYLVIASTDPKNDGNDLAAGIDIRKKGIDQVGKGLGDWEGGGSGNDKGITALYTVIPFKLPNGTARTNIILRHDQGKMGKASHFEDVVGTLSVKLQGPVVSGWTGYDANSETYYNTSFWPLHATGGPHGNVIDGTGDEDFRAGRVYQRNDLGKGTRTGIHEKKLSIRGWTGIGYDVQADNNAENGGTPGYSKDSLKSKASEVAGTVSISEIMLVTDEETEAGRVPRATRLPQWFEIFNASLTQGVNLNNWYLEIQNADSEDLETRNLSGTLRLPNVTIPPNQTVLIVSNSGLNSGNFPEERMINLFTNGTYRNVLNLRNRGDSVLSQVGFYIELRDHENRHVDEIGNLGYSRRAGAGRRDNFDNEWEMPELNAEDGHRTSLIRVYNNGSAADGLMAKSWLRASDTNFRHIPSLTYFGNHRDYGTPGYRGGGPLPVSLSKFRPERLDDGSIVVRWITESELNNAGFNILRSDTRDGEFVQVNTKLIAGKGTTSERNDYEFVDTSAKPNVIYYYQIQDVSLDGQVTTLRVSRLKGNVTAAGKATTTWGELKTLQ